MEFPSSSPVSIPIIIPSDNNPPSPGTYVYRFLSCLKSWILFHLPLGEALVVVGVLDVMLAVTTMWRSLALYTVRYEELEASSLPMEWSLLALSNLQIVWGTMLLWGGGVSMGRSTALSLYCYISITHEILLQLLSWISGYNAVFTVPVPLEAILQLSYRAVIRVLIRIHLLTVVILYILEFRRIERMKRDTAFPQQPSVKTQADELHDGDGVTKRESIISVLDVIPVFSPSHSLAPIGSGPLNTFRFYSGDIHRLSKLLLTVDFTWGLYRLLGKEIVQMLFEHGHFFYGAGPLLPASRLSRPILAEERVLRVIRMGFDLIMLHSLHKDNPPLRQYLIIPRIIEISVSSGILIFLRLMEIPKYPTPLFTFFYITFIFDLLFRTFTFLVCLKAYSNFLTRCHRAAVTAVANIGLPSRPSVLSFTSASGT